MGECWFAPQPRCPVHGRMRHDFEMCRWVCAGWDGEGCGHVVTDEEMARVPLSQVRPGWWAVPFTVTAEGRPGG